jgi:Family of unknown function (DUF5329)
VKIRSLKIAVLALTLASAPLARAEPPAIVQQEIDYLLRYIGDSACEFKRNGSWNTAKAAQAHVRMKYDSLLSQGQIETTKDFIDHAATKSSLSGQPYEIKCGADSPIPSNLWLNNELARYQAQTSAGRFPPSVKTR